MYGETFYGRHTAQHQLQWSQIKIKWEKPHTVSNLDKNNDNIEQALVQFSASMYWLKTGSFQFIKFLFLFLLLNDPQIEKIDYWCQKSATLWVCPLPKKEKTKTKKKTKKKKTQTDEFLLLY